MRIADGGRVIWSATDLKKAADCEFAWVRGIDAKLGRIEAVDEPEDAMMRRAIDLGLEHEKRVLADYRRRFPGAVVEIEDVSQGSVEDRDEAFARTLEALRSTDAQVVYQGAFTGADFIGFADFIVRTPDGWLVQDTKLARTARVTALMQLVAYVDRLEAAGIPVAPTVELILGTGEISTHRIDDIRPVFRLRRERLRALIADRQVSAGAAVEAVAWADERGELGLIACGRCATCESESIAHRDLLLVAGMRPQQRRRLRSAGIMTIDDLAVADTAPEDIAADVFRALRIQAQLQLASPAGVPVAGEDAPAHPVPTYEVILPSALAILPPADPGDIFFDFEGDPLYTEGAGEQWGLDYLFGWVDDSETYSAIWAHDFAAEKAALETFLRTVSLMRSQHPQMHIYHYAPYEPTHLAAMAARHGFGEAEVDRLLAEGVFVDLYPIIKRAVRVGSRSYSIKKLEPLYMGDEVRTADVQKGDESIERYVEARALAADGHAAAAQDILDDLADYNRYDCVSTRRLRDWLRARAAEAGVEPGQQIEAETNAYHPSERSTALLHDAEALAARTPGTERTAEETALRLAAAAIDYHPRESRAFWAGHYLRLREPLSSWNQGRDVLTVDPARSFVAQPWYLPERAHSPQREVMLRGEIAPGSSLREGSEVFTIYERPVPFPALKSSRWINVPVPARIIEVRDDGLLVAERGMPEVEWERAPIAVVPGPPPSTKNIQERIDLWADGVLRTAPALPRDAATDVLLRRPPRTRSGRLTPSAGDDVAAIVASVRDLDSSYVAVQGPPGTGKTFVGSHVIARLVADHGYRIGVVAQSHAVVENLLSRVVQAGLPIERVGKATADKDAEDERFTLIPRDRIAPFREEFDREGFVIGGTAWDFCNARRVPPGSLDLLVIDEAGQYSLANTVATSVAARDLLLLGDPQQLPQVSQGTHPEPVDTSALGWVMDGDDVIRPEFGYFLEHTWRMRPEVADVVSALSYEGRLTAAAAALERSIEGIEPGVHALTVDHRGNTSYSEAEAARVVELVEDLIGRDFDPGEGAAVRPIAAHDIIVVTPYNAQQQTVHEALVAAGFAETPVGTVDKFQGQEAAVAIVSLAASSAREAPRGLEFLLLENRLNVAISRAQVAAYVLYAPGLLDDLPRTPAGVARLSAFTRMVGAEPADE